MIRKINAVTLISLLILIGWSGCATNKPDKNLSTKHPEWSAETVEKVQNGVVELGMTRAQVMEALKNREAREFNTLDNKWTYVDAQTLGAQENVTERINILTFEDDRLVDIDTQIRMYHKPW